MVYIRSRKFCCCLPVRFGVFVMTFFGTFGGGAIAVYLWVQGARDGSFDTGSTRDRTVAGVNAAVWTLLAIVSLFGLIGTIAKRIALVQLYATLLFINLALSVATGVYQIYVLFQDETKQRIIDKCVNDNEDASDSNFEKDAKKLACKSGYFIGRTVIIPVFIFTWLFLLYGCVIVSNYVGQLREEEDALQTSYALSKAIPSYPGTTGYHPVPVNTNPHVARSSPNVHEAQPLTAHDHNEYPYNAPQHSFGSK